ncbi:MAG: sulfite exporter TauE/SafE family protein [Steroidobacteraceae bacterium]
MDLAQALAGFVVGATVGLTGVGGGSLMTPILVLLFGIHPATAVGTDLLQAAITKAGGTFVHANKGRVDWRISSLLAAGSLPAAVLTLLSLHYFTNGLGGSKIITTTLGVALLLTAAALALRTHLRRFSKAHDPEKRRHPAFTIVTGAVLGCVVSLSSVGAGALGITALFFLYPRLPAGRIVASDLAHAVPLTLVAGLGHWLFGSVDWMLLVSLLVGSLPGIYVGSQFAGRVPETFLRFLLAAVLVLVGGKLIVY